MARLGITKKKKSPRATELSQLKKQLQRVTEQLESRDREQTATSEILRLIATLSTRRMPRGYVTRMTLRFIASRVT